MSTLTVVINTKNEEKNISQCIKSVQKLTDKILVVDMNSSDGTVAVAEKLGARVIHYKTDHGFADPARDFALTNVKTDWVLILDADERIEKPVLTNIEKLITSDEFDVYYLPRKNVIFDKWIEHTGWWPDYQPRLFKKGFLHWPGKVHAQPVVKGNVKHLPATEEYAITHYNYADISQFISKLNRYTSLTAKEVPSVKKTKPISQTQVLDKFFSEFLRRYFGQDGILDGAHGAGLSLFQATYEMTTFLKTWEMGGYKEAKYDSTSSIKRLRKLQKEINYWVADYQIRNSVGLNKIFWRIRRKFSI